MTTTVDILPSAILDRAAARIEREPKVHVQTALLDASGKDWRARRDAVWALAELVGEIYPWQRRTSPEEVAATLRRAAALARSEGR